MCTSCTCVLGNSCPHASLSGNPTPLLYWSHVRAEGGALALRGPESSGFLGLRDLHSPVAGFLGLADLGKA